MSTTNAAQLTLTINRLQAAREALSPGSKHLEAAYTKIGNRLRTTIISNITKQGLVLTGHLRKSIQWHFITDALVVGSFNVRYAAIHEFGFRGVGKVKGFTRRGGKVSGHSRTTKHGTHKVKTFTRSGGKVSAHDKKMNVTARPYLRPAFEQENMFILNALRAAVKGAFKGEG